MLTKKEIVRRIAAELNADQVLTKKILQRTLEIILETLAAVKPATGSEAAESYLAGLRHCMDKLRPEDRELLDFRYVDDLSAEQIAARLARSRQSVGRSLLRVRRELLQCIEARLVQEEHP